MKIANLACIIIVYNYFRYLLKTGKIILYEKQSRKVFATLNNGEKFGEY